MLKLSILQQINVILNKLSCAGAVRLQRQIDHGLMDIHLKFTEFCCFFSPKKCWVQKNVKDILTVTLLTANTGAPKTVVYFGNWGKGLVFRVQVTFVPKQVC